MKHVKIQKLKNSNGVQALVSGDWLTTAPPTCDNIFESAAPATKEASLIEVGDERKSLGEAAGERRRIWTRGQSLRTTSRPKGIIGEAAG